MAKMFVLLACHGEQGYENPIAVSHCRLSLERKAEERCYPMRTIRPDRKQVEEERVKAYYLIDTIDVL